MPLGETGVFGGGGKNRVGVLFYLLGKKIYPMVVLKLFSRSWRRWIHDNHLWSDMDHIVVNQYENRTISISLKICNLRVAKR